MIHKKGSKVQIDSNQKIKEDIFKAIPKHLIANVIASNYPSARVTDKLIESYIELALTKQFTTDKTIHEIRKLNSFDVEFEDKITFTLDDSSRVVISEEMYDKVCESINNKNTIEFMRKNKENFLNCIDILQEDTK